jgi:hypothetical protein
MGLGLLAVPGGLAGKPLAFAFALTTALGHSWQKPATAFPAA